MLQAPQGDLSVFAALTQDAQARSSSLMNAAWSQFGDVAQKERDRSLIRQEAAALADLRARGAGGQIAGQIAAYGGSPMVTPLQSSGAPGQAAPTAQPTQTGYVDANFDWTPYRIDGALREDGISGLRPEMQSNLAAFLQAADAALGSGLQVYSGYRSPELQAELYRNAVAKYGSESAARKWVAPPGNSRHNHGSAADLKFKGVRIDKADPAIAQWIASNAPRYGLAVPMSWEPWQVELAGARRS